MKFDRRGFVAVLGGLTAMLTGTTALADPSPRAVFPSRRPKPGDVWQRADDIIVIKGVVTTEGPGGPDGYVHDQAGKVVSFTDLAAHWRWAGILHTFRNRADGRVAQLRYMFDGSGLVDDNENAVSLRDLPTLWRAVD